VANLCFSEEFIRRISRQPTPVTIKIDQKQPENVKCFKYLGSLLTDDGRCTCEIKFEKETSEMLHLDASGSRSETPRKF
jgi:hypothetical protein